MATLLATRDGDKLFGVGNHTNEAGVVIYHGYIEYEDGTRTEVPNIDVLLGHGYWEEIID
jgi:hypothetical protein